MYISICDISKRNIIDYKGLDLSLFVAGSQFYYSDESNIENCLVKTEEDLTDFNHIDVMKITEEEYWEIIEDCKPHIEAEPNTEDKVSGLENRIKATEDMLLMLMLDEVR